ncbi:hypothetical protein WOLCODRAFT_154062 [Wolfiporia cocos MD-104 SS10]|uniref:Uncharacterized protein n=1 Tax=Wolfiporia cocos (strain MD-104) TaxID=742152 RepID=A0A2H3K1L6_WOLCO|nr:hypothetical protein WOLCODRAFT_154062 [Wolfiporia cocos MD-104 SS10]
MALLTSSEGSMRQSQAPAAADALLPMRSGQLPHGHVIPHARMKRPPALHADSCRRPAPNTRPHAQPLPHSQGLCHEDEQIEADGACFHHTSFIMHPGGVCKRPVEDGN